ncbi:proteasome assembly chaperone 4 isoform X2 [Heterocephalus glaber]|uniref:Proteasome assembly chaperone 4 isoform X2 n=1 Tax=Heterocephalus glaber TaxID=10181 RepID=A0AAX6T2A9_HETGA|nr:proteasome assembly chaperone 4 isoform X2 [Heterocephalus glaber]
MEEPRAAAGGDVSVHNFSARLWEQLVHFHVMRLTDSLFLWVGATPHLRNLAVAMCSRYDPQSSVPLLFVREVCCLIKTNFGSIPGPHPRVHLPPWRHFRHRSHRPRPAPRQEDQQAGVRQLQPSEHRQ